MGKIHSTMTSSKESQSTKPPVSLSSLKSPTGAAYKEFERGRMSSVVDSKRLASHQETGEDASARVGLKVEHSGTTINDPTEEKENTDKKQQDYWKESALEVNFLSVYSDLISKGQRHLVEQLTICREVLEHVRALPILVFGVPVQKLT